MGRKRGPDIKKLEKIRKILKQNPNGVWIRKIAREGGLDKSTVSIYLNKYMSDDIETIFHDEKGKIKVVGLKEGSK